tara:strand:- start:3546 stop:3746 length:201 start_codon:yes stop_codon:yes gene_type:complete
MSQYNELDDYANSLMKMQKKNLIKIDSLISEIQDNKLKKEINDILAKAKDGSLTPEQVATEFKKWQ